MLPNDENEPLNDPQEVSIDVPVNQNNPLPAPASDPDDEVTDDLTEYRANAKVDVQHPIRKEMPEGRTINHLAHAISLMYTTVMQADSNLRNIRGNKTASDPASLTEWVQSLQAADAFTPVADKSRVSGFAAWRPGAEWRQFIEHDGKHLRLGAPKLSDTLTGTQLSGEAAIQRVQSRMSMGSHVQIPLWNTGIWVTLRPGLDDEFLELMERIQLEKITLGRETRGLVFDNHQVYTLHHLMNFVYNHITATTLKYGVEGMESALDEAIKITDIPNLLMGLLCAMYPHGYELVQPCTADISKCNAVFKGLINLTKIMWTDTSRLTEKQRRHMTIRKNESMSMEDVKEYQEQFPPIEGRVINLRNDINVVLEVPNMGRYRDFGTRWVDAIDRDTAQVFGTDLKDQARETYMYNQAVISTLQAYSHWFREIVIVGGAENGEDQIIHDPTTLENLAKTLSSDLTVRSTVEDGIRRFNDYASCTIVGIVNFECPSCHQTQLRPDAPNQVIIPIDVVSTFFTLLSNRLDRILR